MSAASINEIKFLTFLSYGRHYEAGRSREVKKKKVSSFFNRYFNDTHAPKKKIAPS